MRSEFGKGLSYCLGLFLAHADSYILNKQLYQELRKEGDAEKYLTKELAAELFFNGASDHLYELQWQKAKSKRLQSRLRNFADKCLKWGHGFDPNNKPTEKDVQWAIQEAKNLLRLIDKENGVPVCKGEWE